ncbi:MAG: hypothetical protein ACTHJX_13055 [Terriglobales bacterium]
MNYFNYFTEIEEHFQRKRGAQILLSPVDWALIESWRAAGIPLAAVLAGIDQAFEKFDSGRRRDTQRRRSLMYCAAAVLDAAAALQAAAQGAPSTPAPPQPADDAFSTGRIRTHLLAAADAVAASSRLASRPERDELAAALRRFADSLDAAGSLEAIERHLTVLDDKLLNALTAATPVDEMVRMRAAMEQDLAPYRRGLRTEQLNMIERQFLHRRLLEAARLPRLSLFYLDV